MAKPISNVPELYGLVLVGGTSSRMGKDKAMLSYYSKPHYQHLVDLLGVFCSNVFISTKSTGDYAGSKIIKDHYSINGPLNGILSGFQTHPDKAWLTIACDMPFIDEDGIKNLITQRDPKKLATCYQKEGDDPEPLFCIWEPTAFKDLQKFLESNGRSPRKFLKEKNIKSIVPQVDRILLNINTPEDYNKLINS